MIDLFDIEGEAQRLERRMAMGIPPEIQLLLGIEFFRLLRDESQIADPDPYLIQFLPRLAAAASQSDPGAFFPDEVEALAELAEWIGRIGGETHRAASAAIARISEDSQKFLQACLGSAPSGEGGAPSQEISSPPDAGASSPVTLNCLFVEHFPDIDIAPRGRLLKLSVSATAISKNARDDDVVVRNPVTKPDDRFLAQARNSIRAARSYMHSRYGLSLTKRFRFDFAVDSSGARFTGDSLGVAFAAGAIAALARIEVLRERLAISPDVAFSGALSKDGKIGLIDGEALRCKIDRAFFSPLQYVVIPREHITEAWAYLSELESRYPNRTLRLVDAETLAVVAADPRLVHARQYSLLGYAAKKTWNAKRMPAVEVTALVGLAAALFILIAPPQWMPWFDGNPEYCAFIPDQQCLRAYNKDSMMVCQIPLACRPTYDFSDLRRVYDLDGDKRREILFMNLTDTDCEGRGWLYCYDADGVLRFKRYCAIPGEYPGDTTGVLYDVEHLNVVHVRGRPLILTEVAQSNPARSHIRLWSANGDSLGWYINAGGSHFVMARDLDRDGNEDLIFFNYNNRMNCTAILVLRSDSLYGCSPPYSDPSWDLTQIKRGTQLAYVLLPTSDAGRLCAPSGYGSPEYMRDNSQGLLDFYVSEASQNPPPHVVFSCTNQLRIRSVGFTDQYRRFRDKLVDDGKLPTVGWKDLSARLLDSVKYWTDSGWVSEGELRPRGTN